MPQSLQIVFHGVDRSEAVEQAVTKNVEALRRFDQRLGPCKVTVSQEGHQTIGEYSVRVDVLAAGHDVIVNRSNMDVMLAINDAFDSVRRAVKDEADKRRNH